MKSNRPRFVMPFLLCAILAISTTPSTQAYITNPVPTLGALSHSTYITVIKVEKVSQEKGIIIYSKVRDLKGKYPAEKIRHIFDLKNTPQHKGQGDVPIRPDEKDWRYAVESAKVGNVAVMFTKKYDPFGDFGHVYFEGCWYAIMCPPRDWELWYAIYAEPKLLERWHCGTTGQLISAIEAITGTTKEAVLPVLGEGTKEDLRAGKAKVRGLRVKADIGEFDVKRDLVTGLLDKEMVPSLVKSLQDEKPEKRAASARDLGLIGPAAKAAIPNLVEVIGKDTSDAVIISAVDALDGIGPDPKIALPALQAALKDPRFAQRKEVLAKITEVYNRHK